MEKITTYVNRDHIVKVVYTGTPSGQNPHDLIKEYVRMELGDESYEELRLDKAFDEVFQLGLDFGTQAYDEAMSGVLNLLGINEEDVINYMNNKPKSI